MNRVAKLSLKSKSASSSSKNVSAGCERREKTQEQTYTSNEKKTYQTEENRLTATQQGHESPKQNQSLRQNESAPQSPEMRRRCQKSMENLSKQDIDRIIQFTIKQKVEVKLLPEFG